MLNFLTRKIMLGSKLKIGSEDSDEICIVCDRVMFFVKRSDWGKLTPQNPIENLIIFFFVHGCR